METLARGEKERLIEELLRGAEPRPLEWRGFLARLAATRTRKRLRSGEEKTYTTYKITIPQELAEELGLEEGAYLGVLAARLRWYHYYDYNDPDVQRWFWSRLPAYAKAELCMLGAAPEQLCRDHRAITVIASEEELRRLGLEPGQPVTLGELRGLLERAKNLETRPCPSRD